MMEVIIIYFFYLSQSSNGNTPRCLRRADSGVPGEEPHRSGSGSSGSSPPDPPGSSTSESSSGVHSSTSLPNQRPRANSLDDFVLDQQPKDENRLKSFSLQRGAIPPTFHTNKTDSSQSVYGFSGIHYTTIVHPINSHLSENGLPSQITENGLDSVIIRRKSMQPKAKVIVNTPPVISEEPFGRSTNMKMTTFTNSKESLRNIVASSATLPHYPTQPMDMVTPHCSTMPLALEARGVMMPPPMVSGSSCQSFARPHCTLPTHQGGLRLVGAVQAIRRPPVNPRGNPSHHSFPVHLIQPTQFGIQNHLLHDIERDSANFSMASSGDSDNNMYMNANRA